MVPLNRIRWSDYDVVKTLFHVGFQTLADRGGGDHPFIISKLGSVVEPGGNAGHLFLRTYRREHL